MASRRLDDLAGPVRAAALLMCANAGRAGLSVLIYCTLRSHAEQNAEYAKGRDALGNIVNRALVVTNARAGMSLHNPDKNGLAWAFDAVPLVNGVAQWNNNALLLQMGELGEAAGLEWAGRWKGSLREKVHFQMKETT